MNVWNPLGIITAVAVLWMLSAVLSDSPANAAELESSIARYCVDDKTGRLEKIIDKRNSSTPVTGVFNEYKVLAKSGDYTANENEDHVVSTSHSKDVLSYQCCNDQLKHLAVTKRYWIENDALRRELTFTNHGKEKLFLQNATESQFSKPFLEHAYYFGAGYLGPYLPATKPDHRVRVDDYVQTSKGMVLSNHDKSLGSYTNYRVKINDNVVYPWWQSTIGRYRELGDRLYYTPHGWSMCHGTLDVEPNGGKIRYTDCFSFFQGDIYNFFADVFGRDADFQRDLKSISRPPGWMLDIFCYAPSDEGYLKYLDSMTDEGMIIVMNQFCGDWADYRWEDGANGVVGGFITADEWREFSRNIHAISHRIKFVFYGITVAADIHSPIYKEHPEWFRQYNREGKVDSLFPGMMTNFQTMYNLPDCRTFMAENMFDTARDFGYDLVYLDEAQQQNTINWQTMELLRDDHVVDLWKQMRARCDKDGVPIFMNGSGQPYADINFIEAVMQLRSSNWRNFTGVAMGLEWFSLFRPTGRIIPLYWYARRHLDYHNRCVALGWIPAPSTNYGHPLVRSPLGTMCAAYETGKTLPVPVSYTPDWKVDPKVDIESYTVRRLDSSDRLLSFIQRSDKPSMPPVTVKLDTLGFSPDQAINVWMMPTKHCTEDRPDYALSDRENKENYRKHGWYGGTITSPKLVYSGKAVGTLSLELPGMARDEMVQLVATRSPAALYTIEDLPLNYFYTRRKGVEIKDGKVHSERKQVDVILADKLRCFDNVKLNGKPVAFKTVDIGGTLATVFAVPAGDFDITYDTKEIPAVIPTDFTVSSDGRTIQVEGGRSEAVYAIDFNGRTMATTAMPFTLPEQYENGAYVVRLAGTPGPGKRVTLQAGKPSAHKLESTLLTHPEEVNVEPVDLDVQGLKVTRKATMHGAWNDPYNFQRNILPYEYSVEPEALKISAGSTRRERGYTNGLIPPAYAGLELSGAKQLSFKLDNTFYYCPNLRIFSDSYWLGLQTTFIGLVVDFRVEGKYTHRVDFSVGGYNSTMRNPLPKWGANKVQDRHIDLGSLIEESNERRFTLDLTKYAPQGWDGTVFLSVGTSWPQPRRKLILTITGVNTTGADDFIEGFDAANATTPRRVMPEPLAVGRLKTAPVSLTSITPEEWKRWPKIPELLPYPKNQDKILEQQTEAFLACDKNNLYIAVHCREPNRKPIAVNSNIWRNECVEFHFLPSDGRWRQLIIDGTGSVFTKNFDDANKLCTQFNIVEKDGWYVFAAVPFSALGIREATPGQMLRFNLVRCRLGSRPEVSTWGPVEGNYNEAKYFGTLTIGRLIAGQGKYEDIPLD